MPDLTQNMKKQVMKSQVNQELEQLNKNKKEILDLLEAQKEQIRRAFPRDVNVDRVIRIITTALSREPILAKCTPVSILGCAIQSAQLGLEPDSVLGQCYFIPFYNSQKKVYEAQLIVGYRGYIDLAYRSGMIKSVFAMDVKKDDEFSYEYGNNQFLKHIPKYRNSTSITWDDIIGSYAYVYTIQGGFVFKVLDKLELEIARSYSKTSSEKSAWNLRPNIMAMKTSLRQLNKFMPLSPQLRIVDMLESMYEGDRQDWENIIEIQDEKAVEKFNEVLKEVEPNVKENGVDNALQKSEKNSKAVNGDTIGSKDEGFNEIDTGKGGAEKEKENSGLFQ